ncbi:MAG: nucleotidyltransferase domain-containing protein [Euryarchaeota archaeon]|nr:nucleotidyltransferase domain-containing protein [Euryarchaeota archaeon]MBU4607846.1 nucleotidyltransferase domain-containing protein [Euryarchaeota archaeon]MBV1729943.1 nucleotidyltransferase domain-containing protein [Methanobacterium sp.]MBV1756129.1 nucleotidyltransferase domain-containing protein [Methanobacterium sp.]MBV1766766.1 nucleotidyltransferase domain-containing protein [Methanobacterium sp.]
MQESGFQSPYNKLNSLNFPFISLIFGSNAKKVAQYGSDIDLLIICEKNRENDFESIISLLPLDIHLTILNFEEFMDTAMSKEFTVVSEAMKNNIILVGIEDYYRVLNNVR